MKNIYEQFNNIEFDIDKLNSTNIEIDELTKNKLKKNLKYQTKKDRKKKIYKRTAISVASFLLIFSLAYRNESFVAFARNIPILGSIFETFEYTDKKADFNSYSQKIGETQKSNGYELTFNEVVFDDYRLMMTYTIKSKEKITIQDCMSQGFPTTTLEDNPKMNNTTKLNNKNLIGGGSGDAINIDEHTIQILEIRDINDLNLGNNVILDIDIKKIKNTIGSWKFKIPITKEKISKNIKTFNPNIKIQVPGVQKKETTLIIYEVSFSPISTNICFKSKDEVKLSEVTFKDENGNIIESLGSSTSINYGKSVFEIIYELETMKEIPNKIFVEYMAKETGKVYKTELNLN